MSNSWGIYVHVPWCRVRCPYCAFYVEADRDAPWTAYVDAVLREHSWRRHDYGLSPHATLYLGGGTPSRMPIAELARLTALGGRISMEANPEDVDPDWLSGAIDAGVQRLSVGVQTFNPDFARLLNRNHTVRQARQTLENVARAGLESWSVDVIFGLPGQSLEDLRRDIEAILALSPPHVSLYGLTFEPGTPFDRARVRGSLVPVDEDVWRAMYDLLVHTLSEAGLDRYEVSNFARPGHESLHNRLYWTGRPYLGLGPSAHGFLPDGRRYSNVRDVARYLVETDPTDAIERPTAQEAAVDVLISGMRGRDGVGLADIGRALGDTADLERAGWLHRSAERVWLGHDGYPVADAVISTLVKRLS